MDIQRLSRVRRTVLYGRVNYISHLCPFNRDLKWKDSFFFDRPSAARLSIIERSTHRFTFLPLFTFQPWITLFRRQNNVTGLNLSVRDTRRFVGFIRARKFCRFWRNKLVKFFLLSIKTEIDFCRKKYFFLGNFMRRICFHDKGTQNFLGYLI